MNDQLNDILYQLNNIKRDRCELYSDYVQSLYHLIFDTYLGDDMMNYTQQINHFKWCWNKNRDNFATEGIKFKDSEELYNYFMVLTLELYYPMPFKEESDDPDNKLLSLWRHLLDYSTPKSDATVASFIKVYNLFNNALKN